MLVFWQSTAGRLGFTTRQLGRVVQADTGLPFRLKFPDTEHQTVSSFLCDLSASGCSPATLRSYANDLLRWFRFLHGRFVAWERAERLDVRALVNNMSASPTANALRRGPENAAATNAATRKPGAGTTFSANSIKSADGTVELLQHCPQEELGALDESCAPAARVRSKTVLAPQPDETIPTGPEGNIPPARA